MSYRAICTRLDFFLLLSTVDIIGKSEVTTEGVSVRQAFCTYHFQLVVEFYGNVQIYGLLNHIVRSL